MWKQQLRTSSRPQIILYTTTVGYRYRYVLGPYARRESNSPQKKYRELGTPGTTDLVPGRDTNSPQKKKKKKSRIRYTWYQGPGTKTWYQQSSPPRNRCDVFPPTTTTPHEDIIVDQYEYTIPPSSILTIKYFEVLRSIILHFMLRLVIFVCLNL